MSGVSNVRGIECANYWIVPYGFGTVLYRPAVSSNAGTEYGYICRDPFSAAQKPSVFPWALCDPLASVLVLGPGNVLAELDGWLTCSTQIAPLLAVLHYKLAPSFLRTSFSISTCSPAFILLAILRPIYLTQGPPVPGLLSSHLEH